MSVMWFSRSVKSRDSQTSGRAKSENWRAKGEQAQRYCKGRRKQKASWCAVAQHGDACRSRTPMWFGGVVQMVFESKLRKCGGGSGVYEHVKSTGWPVRRDLPAGMGATSLKLLTVRFTHHSPGKKYRVGVLQFKKRLRDLKQICQIRIYLVHVCSTREKWTYAVRDQRMLVLHCQSLCWRYALNVYLTLDRNMKFESQVMVNQYLLDIHCWY